MNSPSVLLLLLAFLIGTALFKNCYQPHTPKILTLTLRGVQYINILFYRQIIQTRMKQQGDS